jgi:preprotein translocase subunit SecE
LAGSSSLSTRAIFNYLVSEAMSNIRTYINDTVEEMKNKVSWPTYAELQSSSVLVLIGSLIFALIVGAMDFGFDTVLTWFYNQF